MAYSFRQFNSTIFATQIKTKKTPKSTKIMKKRLTFSMLLCVFCALYAMSTPQIQELKSGNSIKETEALELQDENGTIINNSVIRVETNDTNTFQLQAHVWIKNNLGTNMDNIYVKRTLNKEVAGSTNSICFGVLCYPPWVGTSSSPYSVAAGALDKSFYGDYQPDKKTGITSVTYEFYDSLSQATPVYAKTTVEFIVVGSEPLVLSDELGNKINNGTVRLTSNDVNVFQIQAHIWIKNQAFVDLNNIYVKRTVNQEVPGSTNSVCFGDLCYPPWVGTSIDPFIIPADVLDKSFYGDYQPEKNGGITSVTYEFYDSLTMTFPLHAKTTIEYHLSGLGVNEDKFIFKGPFPNPSSQNTAFEYNLPANASSAQLIIRNMLGVELENATLPNRSGKKIIDVSSYPSGIYFYTIVMDGKELQSKKMIVKH